MKDKYFYLEDANFIYMNFIKKTISSILFLVPDYWLNFLVFLIKQKQIPEISNPRSLSEKILHIKLYDHNPVRALVVDRIKVREYVSKKTSNIKFSNMLWHGRELTLGIWNGLPEKFILKGNHGSGMVLFVDKKKQTFEETKKIIKKWMNMDYASISREWFYGQLEKYVIAEEILEFKGNIPPDYKFFCFNGKVEIIQVDLNRFSEHTRNIYDKNFNKLNVKLLYPAGPNIQKPYNFDLAIKIAEDLSIDFDFARIDLFILNEGVYFGEITNTPGGGFERFIPREFDFKLGGKLKLGNLKTFNAVKNS